MARYTGPKNRLSRRAGIDLGLKTVGSHAHNQLLRRLNLIPGQHGPKGMKKISDFGQQLREKQRARLMYGLLERQFRKYFEQATHKKGATGEMLLQLLERRLDNVIYRLGFAPTRAAARQLVSHGHVMVMGKKMTIPSYQTSADEKITLKDKTIEIPAIKAVVEQKNPIIPGWLKREGTAGVIVRMPNRDEMEIDINEQLIVEYYSR